MDDTQLRHEASEIERRVGDELFSHQQLTLQQPHTKEVLPLTKTT